MRIIMTHSTSLSGTPSERFTNRRRIATVVACVWLSLVFCGPIPDASALPTADAVIKELHFSDSDRDRILKGEILDWSASEGSDRELAIGIAFLVNTTPNDLAEVYREALADQVGGFGSSMKHPVSRAITAPYIKEMFRAVQNKMEKQ